MTIKQGEKMSFFLKVLIGLVCVLGLPSFANAKDISEEQYQVRIAQKEYDAAKSDFETTNQQVQQYEKRIAQLNAQLEPLKKSLSAKQERLSKAKINLEEQTKILDNVWEENKKN
jgi:septal ring factor EnvC (AmiA/AmiB activator)